MNLLPLLLMVGLAGQTQTAPKDVWVLEDFTGNVSLSSATNPRPQLGAADKARFLYGGDRLKAGNPKSTFTVVYAGHRKTYSSVLSVLQTSQGTTNTISDYFDLGGAPKGAGTMITYPLPNQPVYPRLLHIHFKAVPGKVSLGIYKDGKALYGPVSIDGSKGTCDDGELGQRLVASGADSFGLVIQQGTKTLADANFDVMPKNQLKKLDGALSVWLNLGGIGGAYGKAMVLLQNQLYYEALDQYLAALKLAPKSTELNMRVNKLRAVLHAK
ncbi:MAG TPA: hypothetical protein VGL56_18595 [Fimbriimonadaceae bacterium]|jgi:hypothetical protein